MKKYYVLIAIATTSLLLTFCHGPKKATATMTAKTTYATNLQPVIEAKCSPCHFPAKGGNKKPYDNYANVSADIDGMLYRIQLNPGEKGFMPFMRAKLSADTIAIFKQFKTDGLLEK